MRSTEVSPSLKAWPLSSKHLLELLDKLQRLQQAKAANRLEGTKSVNPRGNRCRTSEQVLKIFHQEQHPV